MPHPPSHRQLLETAAAGMALGMGMMTVSGGAAVAATAAQPGRRPRVTALTSVYFYLSHASHIVGRFLDGFVVYPEDTAATSFLGEPHKPPFEIASLYIEQTPGGVAAPPANLVSNFQANGSLTTHGIHIFGGSALTLRTSTALGNKEDGVYVTNYNVDGTKSSDVTHIDLGTVASFGHNVLQAATGATPAPNTGAGVCLDLPVAAAQTLNAAGDTFELANCATATPGAIKRSNTCTGGTDIAITGAATTNNITTLNCTHP